MAIVQEGVPLGAPLVSWLSFQDFVDRIGDSCSIHFHNATQIVHISGRRPCIPQPHPLDSAGVASGYYLAYRSPQAA